MKNKWKYVCTQCQQAQCKCRQETAKAKDVAMVGLRKRQRKGANERGYTYRWQKASKAFLAEGDNRMCARCELNGKPVTATVVDHVVPHGAGEDQQLFWDRNNWQGLCTRCHSRKTQKETEAGTRVVVCGHPGSGKTTYIDQRAHKGDVVWCYDSIMHSLLHGLVDKHNNPRDLIELGVALRGTFIKWVRTATTQRVVWVISANTRTATVLAQQIGAKLVVLE